MFPYTERNTTEKHFMVLIAHFKIIFLVYFQDLMRYAVLMMGVTQLSVSTMLGESRQQQQTGSLGWRIGVALTTKPTITILTR